jgi:hypothetical protein
MAMERLPTINFFWPVIIFIGGGCMGTKFILGVSEWKKGWETDLGDEQWAPYWPQYYRGNLVPL